MNKVTIILPTEKTSKSKGVFSPLLQCNLSYVVIRREAIHLYFPPDDCCDMSGAIRLATSIVPKCKCIVTYSGMRADNVFLYERKLWRCDKSLRFAANSK